MALSVAIYTGTRAEYGLLKHLIYELQSDPLIVFKLIVSGTHLSRDHGYTVSEIYDDQIVQLELIPLPLSSVEHHSMADLCGISIVEVSKVLERLNTQILIILGDRYETFAAASAAHLSGIKVVHIHGGETTSGALDDKLRHAITQLSTWHFPSAEPYRQRVIQMGHDPSHVFNIGPMVFDALLKSPSTTRQEFQYSTGFVFGLQNLLVTYHPETLLADYGISGFEMLLQALKKFDVNILFTYPNADAGSEKLIDLLNNFVSSNPSHCWSIPSLGHELYISALKLFDAVVGNSSSGVIEAPLVGIPVLNLGERQRGRHRFGSVIDVPLSQPLIEKELRNVLSSSSAYNRPNRVFFGHCNSPSYQIMSWLRTLKNV